MARARSISLLPKPETPCVRSGRESGHILDLGVAWLGSARLGGFFWNRAVAWNGNEEAHHEQDQRFEARADGSPVRPVSDQRPTRWSGFGADGRKGRTPPAHAKSTDHLHLDRPDQDEVATEVATGATAITFNPVAAFSFAPFCLLRRS